MIRPQAYSPNGFVPSDPMLMKQVAYQIVMASHSKTQPGPNGYYPEAPIGRGGKVDDTCCVVGEVVEWTRSHSEVWTRVRRNQQWQNLFTCGGTFQKCSEDDEVDQDMYFHGKATPPQVRTGCQTGNENC